VTESTSHCPNCERLEAIVAEQARVIEAQARLIQELQGLRAEVQRLTARVEELEAKPKLNSSNSSCPPSSDPPDAPAKPKKEPTGRKAGGQKGHPGHHRPLLPPDKVDAVAEHDPPCCEGCGADLTNAPRLPDPIIHQVTEIPEVKTTTTEHRKFGKRCRCGTITYAALPDGVPAGSFGVRIVTLVGILTGGYRLSKRATLQFVQDVFGVPMSLGSVVACQDAVSAALEAPVDEARTFAQDQPVAGADETSWRERRQKAWLWVLTTPLVAVFLIHAKRGAVGMHALLGKFHGILGSDRWSAYNEWPIRRRQLCWAHLIRDFTWVSEHKGEAERIGKALLEEAKLLFDWWYRVRDGTLKRSSFQVYVSALRRRVETLLEEGTLCGNVKVESRCRGILERFDAMWTFVRVEGVEPSNNASYAARGITRITPRSGLCRVSEPSRHPGLLGAQRALLNAA
jgi:transposase